MYLLHHLLRNTAGRDPKKLAVVFGDERLTYGELDAVTDKLAHTLIENGVRHGDRVGIYLNKSLQSVISVFGILKTGAAYVPLDPNAPLARLSYILSNTGARCLLTSTRKFRSVKQMLDSHVSLEAVVLTDYQVEPVALPTTRVVTWREVAQQEDREFHEPESIETDLAYILFTSGSTGVPKGVMISHLNALTFVNWSCDEFRLSSSDCVSSHAPLHFDLSIFDVFASVKAGATIFPVPEKYSIFPKRLINFIRNSMITVWYSVPSILIHMLVYGNMKNYTFPDLRTLLFAGEVFPTKYLRQLMDILPHAEFSNLYGPTETNVCTFYRVQHLEEERTIPIPIGKACANIGVFALNEENRLVTEPGKEGELCVRGSCVAMGYWRDWEKTEKNFTRNILSSEWDEKMYRTGDIVTLDEEWNYHLIGRRDSMVKSRGYRIELGEVESAFYGHENVKEAAVIAVPDELITNRLKAFIVTFKNGPAVKAEIEHHVAQRLPHYMVPEAIEIYDSLPKTSTGKIDRRVLLSRLQDGKK